MRFDVTIEWTVMEFKSNNVKSLSHFLLTHTIIILSSTKRDKARDYYNLNEMIVI